MDVELSYIHSLLPKLSPKLEELGEDARAEGLPIVRPLVAHFLHVLMNIHKPKEVLEIGCLIGYSSLLMAESLPENGHITTIDRYDKMIPIAKKNFENSPYKEQITLLEGDAIDIIPILNKKYDLIFIDAAKGQYKKFFLEGLEVAKEGTIFVFDDILQHGKLALPREEIEKRQRTIYDRMKEFLELFMNNSGIETSILPIGDGICFGIIKDLEVAKLEARH